jgi:hypothetical protein
VGRVSFFLYLEREVPWTCCSERHERAAGCRDCSPIHAPWLSQIEICFSILQRKALTPNDFANLDALAARITALEDHYRQIAQPFDWTFTRADLDRVPTRIADREPTSGSRPHDQNFRPRPRAAGLAAARDGAPQEAPRRQRLI